MGGGLKYKTTTTATTKNYNNVVKLFSKTKAVDFLNVGEFNETVWKLIRIMQFFLIPENSKETI